MRDLGSYEIPGILYRVILFVEKREALAGGSVVVATSRRRLRHQVKTVPSGRDSQLGGGAFDLGGGTVALLETGAAAGVAALDERGGEIILPQ
jgi:hypothetical protein